MFPLIASGTVDDYIAQENLKLLNVFTIAGGWIIAALILAPVFWKAGEERWKAYIPVYKWAIVFRLASWPASLALLGLVPWVLGLLSAWLGHHAPSTLLWFGIFSSMAGPAPSVVELLQAATGSSSAITAFVLAIAAALTGVIFQIIYGVAVYRMGTHLSRTGTGWLVLSILLPIVPLLVFAVDKSIWLENEELEARSSKISVEVPLAYKQVEQGPDLR